MTSLVLLAVVGQLSVSFQPSHPIGPTLPKLVVTLRNSGKEPLPMVRFESDACFAHFLVRVVVMAESQGRDYDEPAGCPVRSFPGVKGELAAGATEKRELDLGRLFPALKPLKGRYLLFAQWLPKDVEVPMPVNPQSSAGMPFMVAQPLGKVRAAMKKPVELPGGGRFTLLSHGHKDMEGDAESPLMVHGRFAPPGRPEADADASIYFSEGGLMELEGGWVFAVGAYEYGSFMELAAYGKVPPAKE